MPAEQMLYRSIVGVAFVGAAVSLIFSYLAGRNVEERLWTKHAKMPMRLRLCVLILRSASTRIFSA